MTPTVPPPGPRQDARRTRTPRTLRENEEGRASQREGRAPEHKDSEEKHENGGKSREGRRVKRVRQVWEAQRAALAEAFPTWRIVCVADLSIPLWFALYRHPLTPQQEEAGFRPTILRGSAEALQAEPALRCRTTRLPLPPPTP